MLVAIAKNSKLLILLSTRGPAKWLKPLKSRCRNAKIVHWQLLKIALNRLIAMESRVYGLGNFSYSDQHQRNRCSGLGLKMKNGGCY